MSCPCFRPTPGSLWCLDLTQMVLAVQKKLKSTHLNIPNNFCFNNFAQKSIPGVVLANGLLLAVFGTWTSPQMVLAVWKYPIITNIIILNKFCFNNFAQKLIPGLVRAPALQEPVGASHGDQGRKSGLATFFSGPGGQAGSSSSSMTFIFLPVVKQKG